MGIIRDKLGFEERDRTTRMPNAWARDKRLSRRARGLLVELLSHAAGWETSLQQLIENGPEGKDALHTAIAELEQLGYLTRVYGRGARGRFEVDYLLSEPTVAPVDNPRHRASNDGGGKSAVGGFTAAVNPPLKKTTLRSEEHQSSTPSHLPVDNFDDDGVSPSSSLRAYGAAVPGPRPQAAVDIDRVISDVGHLFADTGSGPDEVRAIAAEVLRRSRPDTHISDPTRYVITAIRNDPFEWQKFAFDGLAARAARGGNRF